MISEEEVQETFYNVMISVALESKIDNLEECIKPLMTRTLSSMCNDAIIVKLNDDSYSFGFSTLRGNVITKDNITEEYEQLFNYLIVALMNRTDSSIYVVTLNKIVDAIMEKDTFFNNN